MRSGLPDIVMADGCRRCGEAGGVGGAEGRAEGHKRPCMLSLLTNNIRGDIAMGDGCRRCREACGVGGAEADTIEFACCLS